MIFVSLISSSLANSSRGIVLDWSAWLDVLSILVGPVHFRRGKAVSGITDVKTFKSEDLRHKDFD